MSHQIVRLSTVAGLLFFGFSARAQPISFGVRGGFPLTGAYSTSTTTFGADFEKTFSASKEYIVGPMLEVDLPFGLSVEADALYHPVQLTQEIGTKAGVFNNPSTFYTWEIPVLAQYRFLRLALGKPYVEAGPSFRKFIDRDSNEASSGITVGAGIEFRLLKLRLKPDFRYTRWGADTVFANAPYAPSNRNQVEFSAGLTY
jgi:hypothetical protein